MNLNTPTAILIGSALIALALVFVGIQQPKFQIAAAVGYVWRLEVATGTVTVCNIQGMPSMIADACR